MIAARVFGCKVDRASELVGMHLCRSFRLGDSMIVFSCNVDDSVIGRSAYFLEQNVITLNAVVVRGGIKRAGRVGKRRA